ncbi:hypothetical protein ACA910_021614 [Epithemia clementina (nom. ined.)]
MILNKSPFTTRFLSSSASTMVPFRCRTFSVSPLSKSFSFISPRTIWKFSQTRAALVDGRFFASFATSASSWANDNNSNDDDDDGKWDLKTCNNKNRNSNQDRREQNGSGTVDDLHHDIDKASLSSSFFFHHHHDHYRNNPSDRDVTAMTAAAWKQNLGRGQDDAWLKGPRPHSWFTGLHPKNCPGIDQSGTVLHSLPLINLSNLTRQKVQDYFDNTWTLFETLFAGLHGEEGFYRPAPHGLRHPHIFYYGHTACLYINKLRVAGLLSRPVNQYFESIFEVGVDEMLWDDMHKNDMLWPMVSQVWHYRRQVYQTVTQQVIQQQFSDYDHGTNAVVDQSNPLWALFMAMEHERIHLETSSVLFRETPHHLVQTPHYWPSLHPSASSKFDASLEKSIHTPPRSASHDHYKTSHPITGGDYPANAMVEIPNELTITLGKPLDFPSFGWDNEYGTRTVTVPPFAASQYMISNGEYWHFVADGAGYRTREYWCDQGWAWRTFRNAKRPSFWQPAGPDGSHEYRLRTIFDVIPMPWDWPVDVNYYEAKAFCRWKTLSRGETDRYSSTTAQTASYKESTSFRLLTEAEHHVLRGSSHNLDSARREGLADKVMTNSGHVFADDDGLTCTAANLNLSFGSQSPVNGFAPSDTGHYNVTGNAWEWTEDHFNPLDDFKVHPVYDDFSTPCFDGKHNIIVGGSFISTGDEASVFARFHFRPHFLQHSGFRVVTSEHNAPVKHLAASAGGNLESAGLGSECASNNGNKSSDDGGSSSSSSAGSTTTNTYESEATLHMYLGLHYPNSGRKENVSPIIPHDNAPYHGLFFPQRVAQLLVSLQPQSKSNALDVGCAVGGASFELARHFDSVDAFDYSHSFIQAAKRMQSVTEEVHFRVPLEGDIHEVIRAEHPDYMTPALRSKVNFFTGDACQLPLMKSQGLLDIYDGVIMSNLLCRLSDPVSCLNALPLIVRNGGIVVLVTPFTWLSEFTPLQNWLGGYYDSNKNEAVWSQDRLKHIMESNGFEKIHEEDIPLLIREHARKYQYIVSQASGWRKSI